MEKKIWKEKIIKILKELKEKYHHEKHIIPLEVKIKIKKKDKKKNKKSNI
jgi:hypothetical protein